MTKYQKIVAILNALGMAAADVHSAEVLMKQPGDPLMDRVAAGQRDAIEQLEQELLMILERFSGPVWGELQDATRHTCHIAGM